MSKSIVDKYINGLADKLINEGKRLVKNAIVTKTYKNDTYNLHDSYGAAVYYRGKLIREYYNSPSKAQEPRKHESGVFVYGADDIKEYFQLEFKPSTRGLSLVVVSSMWYGETLEKGEGLKKKYQVISQISSEVDDVASKYKGSVRQIGL